MNQEALNSTAQRAEVARGIIKRPMLRQLRHRPTGCVVLDF
jgi:hypothetical protein